MVFTVDPTIAFRHFQLLKLKHDELPSNFAFNCNLRPYAKLDAETTKRDFSVEDVNPLSLGYGPNIKSHEPPLFGSLNLSTSLWDEMG